MFIERGQGEQGRFEIEILRFGPDSNLSKYVLDCSAVGTCDFGNCEATGNLGTSKGSSALL